MRRALNRLLLVSLALIAAVSVAFARAPVVNSPGNSYYFHTKALSATDAGVIGPFVAIQMEHRNKLERHRRLGEGSAGPVHTL